MEKKPVSENVSSLNDGFWEYFVRNETPPYKITGKYLFFSNDRAKVEEIAIEELENGGFHQAKIPLPGKNSTPEYVLCLYYGDDSRKGELAQKYQGREGIKYRYWKSDAATRHGDYSEDFLQQLTPELRTLFTQDKTGKDV